MELFYVLGAYILFLNIYLFLLMGKDKQFAKQRARRIPEKHFMLWSALGGAIGAYMGMKHYHHKTKHRKFTIGIPVILVIHMLLAIIIVVGVYK